MLNLTNIVIRKDIKKCSKKGYEFSEINGLSEEKCL